MSLRPAFRRLCVLAAFIAITVAVSDSLMPQTPINNTIGLQDLLEKGLKARRPEEFQFIARVVRLVDENRLPLETVMSTFHWARKKARYKGYEFIYFQRALRIRAAKIGVRL